MNEFTRQSIELANREDYLDRLSAVYPLNPDTDRSIDKRLLDRIEYYFHTKNCVELFKTLLGLDLFPIKDSYVPYFKRVPAGVKRDKIIRNNPETVARICNRIFALGLDKLKECIVQPKETNRQMGPLFRRWVDSGVLGAVPVRNSSQFLQSSEFAILSGTDDFLGNFARRYLGWQRADKGLDFVAKVGEKYVIGEAKFITDFGGHQNDQFLDALTTVQSQANPDVVKVAILDGVLYIPNKGKLYKTTVSDNYNILSALLLKEFLISL